MGDNRRRTRKKRSKRSRRQAIRIDVLPDDVLLGIFDFYVEADLSDELKLRTEKWQSLVHVCRRWRTLVLGSPRRLDLRLYCSHKTPAKETLDVWPALPLLVTGNMVPSSGTDNIIAALGQSNRVCEVSLIDLAGWQLEEVLAAMQVPFPELTDLNLTSNGQAMPVIPDSFLDGSAPRLQIFRSAGIPFPGLPKLLSSAARLIILDLWDIPHSGYISPEAIVTLISVLSSLKRFTLEFQSPQSVPDRETRRPPPSKRSVIHGLTSLRFKGVIEYLEDLVTGIDTPQIYDMRITVFNQIDFDTPRLTQFVNRTPKFTKHRVASVIFYGDSVDVRLSSEAFHMSISCIEPDWQLSSIEQVCNSFWHPLSTVESLYIDLYTQPWKDDAIENTLWLQLLLPFTSVKDLHLGNALAPGIAVALQELVGGRITEVLPSLENIFVSRLELSGPFWEKIAPFVAARRRLSNHTITISDPDDYSRSR